MYKCNWNVDMYDERIIIADELNKIKINQLHAATLNFSVQSLEIKKLCVTVFIAFYSLVATLYNKNIKCDIWWIGMIIPILFLFVDSIFYFFQRKLRFYMLEQENKILVRHGLFDEKNKIKYGVVGSVLNMSNSIYIILIILNICVFNESIF